MPAQRVVVDTTVWSLLLRRRGKNLSNSERQTVLELRELIGKGHAILLGMVRMEILSWIADSNAFSSIADHLYDFDDIPPETDDYVRAAVFWNRCRDAGIAPSPVDMLICGVAAGRDLKILTADKDFIFYAQRLPIELHKASIPN